MFVIIKKSRLYLGGPGYSGPSCNWAKVETGKIYKSMEDAYKDCQKLNQVNSVGFEILPYKEYTEEL